MKKKSKFFSIITVFLLVITVSQFLGACSATHGSIYGTVEELQASWPDYYYFDFDLPDKTDAKGITATAYKEQGGCTLSVYYRGYIYDYDFGNDHSSTLTVGRDSRYSLASYRLNNRTESGLTIDGVECLLVYKNTDDITIYSEIENAVYSIRITDLFVPEDEDPADCFLSIVTPAITGRYKGSKN